MAKAQRPIKPVPLEELKKFNVNTLGGHLGIEYVSIGADHISATMPVDARTIQPFGLLHGGASVALAETLGSVAAFLTLEPGYHAVGLEINANHIKGARKGLVTGTAKAIHTGRTTQVWQIDIVDEEGDLVCLSRITMAIIKAKE
jgi:1,4-dihydroxy-2-naphthoyl-CoA hydrolase